MTKQMVMVLVAVLLLTGCGAVGKPVPYEVVRTEQVPAKVVVEKVPGSVGIAQAGGATFAFITAEARQEIELVSVEKASVGIDIHYRIKSGDIAAPHTRVIKIGNPFGVPVGFKKVD